MTVNVSVAGPVSWPMVLFEQDLHPIVVEDASELSGAFEDGMWDEIRTAFGRDGTRYDVELDGPEMRPGREPEISHVRFLPAEADPTWLVGQLRANVSASINRSWLRRRPATPEQIALISAMRLDELVAWVREHLN